MKRLTAFLRLIRPINCLMMGFAIIIGASLASGDFLSSQTLSKLLLGFITAFTLTGASMAINDYYDREIDAINEPSRPIPSGLVKPREALIFALFLTLAGFLAASLTSVQCLIIAVIAWIIFVTYTTRGKRTGLPGNFLVSACVAIPFIYGSFTVGYELSLTALIFSTLAFVSNLSLIHI